VGFSPFQKTAPWTRCFARLELAARSLNIALRAIEVRQVGDFEGAIARMANERCDALLIPNAGLTFYAPSAYYAVSS
jgi:hypothetical protein